MNVRHKHKPRPPLPPEKLFTPQYLKAVERVGLDGTRWSDIYHNLLELSVIGLLVLLGGLYLLANIVFAAAYFLIPGSIAHAHPGSFLDAFFFSVQTMATVGYGVMAPGNLAGNVIATTEVIYGVLAVAMTTGILFARLSRPKARVLFSKIALVTQHDGAPTLIFRVANQRRNPMSDAQMGVVVLRNETGQDGKSMRRFRDANLVRSHSPALALTWTVMHPIDENSPLHGLTIDDLRDREVHIMCNLSGIDDNYAQAVYARHVYGHEDLRWDASFADIIDRRPDGRLTVDYRKFHDTI